MAGLGSELGAFGNTVLVPGLLVRSCYVLMEHQEFGVRCSQVWSNELWSELALSGAILFL